MKKLFQNYYHLPYFKFTLLIFAFAFSFPANCLCVKNSATYLREGPSKKHPIKWEVKKFMPLVELKKNGSWLQVMDLDEDTSWVHRSMVSNDMKCAISKSERILLREGPGNNFKLISERKSAPKYETFKVLEEDKNGWVFLNDQRGYRFWAKRSDLWIQN